MNVTINGRVFHVENELELREFCIWWAVSGGRRVA